MLVVESRAAKELLPHRNAGLSRYSPYMVMSREEPLTWNISRAMLCYEFEEVTPGKVWVGAALALESLLMAVGQQMMKTSLRRRAKSPGKELRKMFSKSLVTIVVTAASLAFLVGCGKEKDAHKKGEDASAITVPEAAHVHDGPGVGQKAATFSLQDVDGNQVNVADIIGKKTLAVVFWGTWCDYCKAEIPAIKKLQASYQDKGFQIISVAVKKDQTQPLAEFHKDVSEFAKDRKLNYTVLLDPEYKAVALYHLHGVPTIIVIDLEGNVRHTGHSAEEAERVVRRLVRT
jgi:peroxiredoxin